MEDMQGLPSEEQWKRIAAENSAIQRCFIITPDAKFRDGPTSPALIPKGLTACPSSVCSFPHFSWLV